MKFLLFLLTVGLIQVSDSDLPQRGPYPPSEKLFHHPEKIMFSTRPYNMDLFVDLDEKDIETISVFIKSDDMENYMEFQLKMIRSRYRHQFNPLITPAKSIEYFFVVSLKDGSIYAIPLDKNGYVEPVKQTLIDPAEYYKQQLSRKK